MSKGQYLLLGGAVALILLLSFMPTVVVDNDKEQVSNATEELQEDHAALPEQAVTELATERERFLAASDRSTKATALQSLITIFVKHNKFDSAAHYADSYASQYPSFENNLKAGDLYYEAFTYAISSEKATQMGQKARDYYEAVMQERPDTLDIQVKVGMTLITNENPMQGIFKIREVLEKDPKNRTALMHLGVLSINSQQWKKAEGRFTKVLEFYPDDEEALYYLGVVYAEQGHQEETLKLFNRLEEISKNGTILQAVKKYKDSIQNGEAKNAGE
ncbi:MAG: tetratricopeptide repeat protein [Flammeovirgaceae bacterium]